MDLVVDANILIAALIKNGLTRELLINRDFSLCTPNFVLEEIFNHLKEISTKAKITQNDLHFVLEKIIQETRITLVKKEEISLFITQAEEISPDPDDIQYFATAIKFNCAIWSNDRAMKNQTSIKIYSTSEIIQNSKQIIENELTNSIINSNNKAKKRIKQEKYYTLNEAKKKLKL